MSTSVCAPSLPTSATIPGHGYYPSSPSSNISSVCSADIIPKRKNVSRNLFGSPDPKSAQYAREKVKEIRAIDMKKWNFDFSKGVPLPGRFQWKPVAVEAPESSTSSSVSESPLQTNSTITTTRTKTTSTSTTITSSTKTPAKLMRINDYFTVRKRKATTSSTVTSSEEKKAK